VNILDKIVVVKKREVALLPKRAITPEVLREAIASRGGVRDFFGALKTCATGDIALIAEIKKASPSKGVICQDFDPVRIARKYESAGASCLSVLTDVEFFQGSLEFLSAIRKQVKIPLLRKDFIIDSRQILEAVEHGADAILLIVSILTPAELQEFRLLAESAGLAALVEVHDEKELDCALSAGSTLIGVNNRDLKTFTVDLRTTERVAAKLFKHKPEGFLVAESGIHTRADVERVLEAKCRGILVGESLLKPGATTIKERIQQLLHG
jgi:indole-3-glycerol phosphate synthase